MLFSIQVFNHNQNQQNDNPSVRLWEDRS
jgi:hypothetical protein